MHELKVTSVGKTHALLVSDDLLAKLKVGDGDRLLAVETPAGMVLTSRDAENKRQLELAEEIMQEDADALQKLAE